MQTGAALATTPLLLKKPLLLKNTFAQFPHRVATCS